MSSQFMQYKTAVFIESVLQKQLSKHRKRLVECKQDKNCPAETYENVLDFCGKLEYAIKEIERFKK